MQEYITPDRTANAIMQTVDSYDTFLVLEGEFDELLFRKFTDKKKNKIEIGFGYENVLKIIEILKDRSFYKVLGIIDSDFRALDEEVIELENVLTTDFHDLEMSVINSDSFENVLSFHVQKEKLVTNYQNYDKFREHLFSVLKPLSFLKWLNKKEKIGLIFKPKNVDGKHLDFSKFICNKDIKFTNIESLVKCVLNYCQGKVTLTIKEEELKALLIDYNSDLDLNHISNGHDVITLIALSLRKNVSNMNSKSIYPDQLQRELYLGYEARYFQNTDLYNGIKDWETKAKSSILTF